MTVAAGIAGLTFAWRVVSCGVGMIDIEDHIGCGDLAIKLVYCSLDFKRFAGLVALRDGCLPVKTLTHLFVNAFTTVAVTADVVRDGVLSGGGSRNRKTNNQPTNQDPPATHNHMIIFFAPNFDQINLHYNIFPIRSRNKKHLRRSWLMEL